MVNVIGVAFIFEVVPLRSCWKWLNHGMTMFLKDCNKITHVGEEKKVTKLEKFHTQSFDFLHYFKPKLKSFILHNFVTRFQDNKFKECFLTFPKDVFLVIDLVENYSL
jgi:hypothetical protein